ncbi:MAG: type I pantothenate kinase [Proteobacteria bacterium]|nr:type I pantothenate kinase [Pseudomonadota bacterium]
MTKFAELTDLLRAKAAAHRARDISPFVIGVTGGVAVGKSTLAAQIKEALEQSQGAPLVLNTDGFLLSNAILQERNLSLRKGYPETYDIGALRSAVAAIKRGERVSIPRYSHVTYDMDTGDPLIVEQPSTVVLDGLHLGSIGSGLVDALLYLDADEDAIEGWFSSRLLLLMLRGREDSSSFYYRFRAMDDMARDQFIKMVWRDINLPNLRDHIVHDRARANVVVRKTADHGIEKIELR